jgi:hypothetical protein
MCPTEPALCPDGVSARPANIFDLPCRNPGQRRPFLVAERFFAGGTASTQQQPSSAQYGAAGYQFRRDRQVFGALA